MVFARVPFLYLGCRLVSHGFSSHCVKGSLNGVKRKYLLQESKCNRMVQRLNSSISNSPKKSNIQIDSSFSQLTVTWEDNTVSRFHPKWIFYNCFCSKCKQEASGQRIMEPLMIPDRLSIRKTELMEVEDSEMVYVHYKEVEHVSILSLDWLKHHSYSAQDRDYKSKLRDVQYLHGSLSHFDYETVTQSIDERYRWFEDLSTYGVNVVDNVPTQLDSVAKVGEMLGGVMHTLYGNTFEVKSKPNPINIAYSTVHLDYHQDLLYYESPPGLQLLHCIQFDPFITGGESHFVDAFHIAKTLQSEYPEHFETLLRIPVTFQKFHFARENPAAFFYQRPHITVNREGKITGVWWAPPFEGPLQVSEDEVEPYFEAYQKFAELVATSPTEITYRLQDGDCVIFNNRRMLHARSAFELNGGTRFLTGCYVNIDAFRNLVQVEQLKRQTGSLVKRLGNQCLL